LEIDGIITIVKIITIATGMIYQNCGIVAQNSREYNNCLFFGQSI